MDQGGAQRMYIGGLLYGAYTCGTWLAMRSLQLRA